MKDRTEYFKQYREANREKKKAAMKEYRKDNKDKLTVYYENNKDMIKQIQKNYYENNKDKVKQMQKEYANKNKDILRDKQKEYREANKDKTKEYLKDYNQKNKDVLKEKKKLYMRERRKNPVYKIKSNLSANLYHSLAKRGYTKNSLLFGVIGLSYAEFKTYIESQFEPWMCWDNYGLYNGELNHGWDIDHIKPTSLAETEDEIYKLNHYTNLRPLCSKVNRDIKKALT